MVKGTALMGDLKAYADLLCIFQKDFLIGHNNKTGGIGIRLIYTLFKISRP